MTDPTAARGASDAADGVTILARIPITFEVDGGGRTHAPLVVGRIGGITRRFVLDTGSDIHFLNRELVDELGLPTEDGEEGTDHSGAVMPSWQVTRDVTLTLGPVDLTLRGIVAIPAPPPFLGHGIGGGLSPQLLHPSAVTVIDLVADELILVEANDATLAVWLAGRHPSLSTLVLPRDPASSTVVVEAAIRGHSPVRTLIDTGGRGTEWAAATLPGVAAQAAGRIGGGVSGADVVAGMAGPQILVVGDRELPIPDLAVREVMHDVDGLVGMDVLRGTVVAAAADATRPAIVQVPRG
jgi:hypothetical protein